MFKEIFADPSKETPAMVRAVASFVAVAALPVILEDIEFGNLASDIVPEEILEALSAVIFAPAP